MPQFNGFNPQVIQFLEDIKQNNNKKWFDEHYDFYQQEILEVSRDLVEALGGALQEIAPGINVVPKVNGSIYRFSRDARFSKDKTPYKTHISYLFWQGMLKRTRCPGFYLAFRPEYIQIGVGINHFTPEYLQAWREQCAQTGKDQQIYDIMTKLKQNGIIMHGEQLKRLPRGFSHKNPDELINADLIRYKGLKCWFQMPLPKQLFSAEFIPWCMQYYEQLLPLFNWMVEVMSHFKVEADFSGQP